MMPSEVRKMSHDKLFMQAVVCGVPENAEAVAEIERRFEIMRELCKAAMELGSCERVVGGIPQHIEDEFNIAVDAFRLMEEERERP